MAINLREIRSAVDNYVNGVPVTISNLSGFPGQSLNPNEGFNFSVDVSNPSTGVRLKDVCLILQVDNKNIIKLKVPQLADVSIKAIGSEVVLQPGTYVDGMRIFFFGSHQWSALEPGENVPALAMNGKAYAAGNANIRAHIRANIDHDWLYPKDQTSNTTNRAVAVTS